MPSFSSTTLRIFRHLLRVPPQAEGPYAGVTTVLEGNAAVSATEAAVAEAAGLGSTFPADTAAVAWRAQCAAEGRNGIGGTLTSVAAEGPRGALAAAMGLAMSGTRATTFLSGPDLAGVQDLLVSAAGRQLPLVLHLSTRALAAQASAQGSGHEAFHLSADSGCFVLFATNVQEAVDYTLIARRVAEMTLRPGLVAMDGEQTALAAQEVRLPPVELARRFVGSRSDAIAPATVAQQLLFGETRRRVPAWHDPDRPILQGGTQGPESWGLAHAARNAYFDPYVEECLEESLALFADHTGRRHAAFSSYRVTDAQVVLVVQGAAVETAEAVADHVRSQFKKRVGVLGVRCLRPFPGARIAEVLASKQTVWVLERMDTPLAGDPPLLRELRAGLDRAQENARFGMDTHPGYPALREKTRPRLGSVVYGLGGLALRSADLISLCTEPSEAWRPRRYLGIDFAHTSSVYPKRQVLLDRLRRAYPEIAALGLRSNKPPPDLHPKGAQTVTIHRLSGEPTGEGLATELAVFLHRLTGSTIRSRPALFNDPWGAPCQDRVTAGPGVLRDAGDEMPTDLLVITGPAAGQALARVEDLRSGASVLITSPVTDEDLWPSLSPNLRHAMARDDVALYCLPVTEPSQTAAASTKNEQGNGPHEATDLERECLLGGVLGVLLDKGLFDINPRRVPGARQDSLTDLPESEREARLKAFSGGLEGVRRVTYPSAPSPAAAPPWDDQAPAAVRHLGHRDDSYASLPRFWDHVGVLYRNGESSQLSADPYLAAGAIPPLSATFEDRSNAREMLPAFEPSVCTGCGRCWTRCPDAAIGAAALDAGALLNAGIRLSGADALRQATTKLADRINGLCRDTDTSFGSFGELGNAAFDWLQDKMPLPDERKQAMREAMEALSKSMGALPVAVTEPFFDQADKEKKGTGALLSLAIDPRACKGCGLCIAACEPGALTRREQDPIHLERVRRQWEAWERIPDTSSAVMTRVAQHSDVGPMAARLLSRRAFASLAGGDGAEAGSGEKLALRLTLAATESHQGPVIERFLKGVRETRDAMTALIRELLADALPADDLDALAESLDGVATRQVDLSTLTSQVHGTIEGSDLDAARLRRLVDQARALSDLEWRLSEGQQQTGRARLGLVLAPGTLTSWAGNFPHNDFQVPVTVDMTGDAAQLAAGVLEGQLAEAAADLKLLRKARLELERPAEAVRRSSELERLGWRDLEAQEQQLCPPLLLVGNDELLAGRGLAQLIWLLGSDLPVKILVLADLELGLASRAGIANPVGATADPRVNLGLLALAQRRAFVAQTSIAHSRHFLDSMEAALGFDGPALLHVHAPSPQRHGFATDKTLEQAHLAVATRVFPLFRYTPEGEGVFGSRLSLEDNPDPREPWASDSQGAPLTPAHWALSEGRYATRFDPLSDDDPTPVALTEYLGLTTPNRKGKTAFVSADTSGAGSASYRVDPALALASEERLHAWRTLQELAGLVTPFTGRIQQEARDSVAAAHTAEIESLTRDHERELQDLRDQLEAEIAVRIQGRLMSLAGYTPVDRPPDDTAQGLPAERPAASGDVAK